MQKRFLLVIFTLFLSGCAFVHKMDVEQGNIYTQEMVSRLHPGMTMSQVKGIMGTPQLLNTFDDNRVTYVYTFQPGGRPISEKYVDLTFHNGVLKNIETYSR